MPIDRIPLPASVPGRLYATGFTDVGPDPDRALRSVDADTLVCLLTDHDIDLRFPAFHGWLEANLLNGRSWWFPIEDGGVADDGEMLALVGGIVEALRGGRHLVTHCGAGIGRTSLVCGLAVVVLADVGLEAALAQVRAARLGAGPENPTQREHLVRLAGRLRPVATRAPTRITPPPWASVGRDRGHAPPDEPPQRGVRQMSKMRFGIFMAPFHNHDHNPNAALHRDLGLIQHLDVLGFDEVWVGEHHSCGTEIIADPMIYCATALERTRTIKIGTGVLSVPYHNPLWTADRVIQLDHLSRGRFLFGVGPGALPTDAYMIGIQPSEQRRMLEEGMDAIMHLLYNDEPLTRKTDWFDLRDAKCQVPLYSEDLEIAVAAIQSPSGPRLAGKHGVGLLSIGATMQIGADVLALHYDVWNDMAQENGHTADRKDWRLVGLFHVAETREQAMRDVEYGIQHWFDYLQHTAAAPQFVPQGETLQERIAWINESGVGAIGTAEDCINQIEALWKQSGGFGTYLCMDHDFANPAAKARSYELMAQRVMPHFQSNTFARLNDAVSRAQSVRAKLNEEQAAALQAWTDKHAAEHHGGR